MRHPQGRKQVRRHNGKPWAGVLFTLLCFPLAVGALSVAQTAELGFGAMTTGSTGGSASISTSGGRTCSGGVQCLATDAGGPARFTVSGDPLTNYTITLPSSVTLSDGASHSMTVDSFVDSLGGTGTTNLSGTDSFTVGATLQINAGQPVGGYSGEFTVTVNYE